MKRNYLAVKLERNVRFAMGDLQKQNPKMFLRGRNADDRESFAPPQGSDSARLFQRNIGNDYLQVRTNHRHAVETSRAWIGQPNIQRACANIPSRSSSFSEGGTGLVDKRIMALLLIWRNHRSASHLRRSHRKGFFGSAVHLSWGGHVYKNVAGKRFHDYIAEQQASIVQDYFAVPRLRSDAEYQRMIAQVRAASPIVASPAFFEERATGLPSREFELPPPSGIERPQEGRGIPQIELRF